MHVPETTKELEGSVPISFFPATSITRHAIALKVLIWRALHCQICRAEKRSQSRSWLLWQELLNINRLDIRHTHTHTQAGAQEDYVLLTHTDPFFSNPGSQQAGQKSLWLVELGYACGSVPDFLLGTICNSFFVILAGYFFVKMRKQDRAIFFYSRMPLIRQHLSLSLSDAWNDEIGQ